MSDRQKTSSTGTGRDSGGGEGADPSPLHLETFLPYRLSLLANTVSNAMSNAYRGRFDLTIPDWRVMAVLARFPGSSARELVDHTRMDKVAISRSVTRLCERGLVRRTLSHADRRRSELRLSARGKAIYGEIIPLAREFEALLVGALDGGQRKALDTLLTTLQAAADAVAGEADN